MHAADVTDFLRPLLGLQLTSTRRAADLTSFQCGPLRPIHGGSAGLFALHVQCPWRLEGPDGLVTGRLDLYEPADATREVDWETWDYDAEPNLQDARLVDLLQGYDPATQSTVNRSDQLVVEVIHVDDFGGLVLQLWGGYRLVIFPAGGRGEQWRCFQPGSDQPHLVCEGHTLSFHA